MYNGHGDVTDLISNDTGSGGFTGSAQAVASYYYDLFGNQESMTNYYATAGGTAANGPAPNASNTPENPYRYAGYQLDKETGLYYLNSRYYDASVGRFTQQDTYSASPSDLLNLNLYVYCANNPLKYTDPTGHDTLKPKPNYNSSDYPSSMNTTLQAGSNAYDLAVSQGNVTAANTAVDYMNNYINNVTYSSAVVTGTFSAGNTNGTFGYPPSGSGKGNNNNTPHFFTFKGSDTYAYAYKGGPLLSYNGNTNATMFNVATGLGGKIENDPITGAPIQVQFNGGCVPYTAFANLALAIYAANGYIPKSILLTYATGISYSNSFSTSNSGSVGLGVLREGAVLANGDAGMNNALKRLKTDYYVSHTEQSFFDGISDTVKSQINFIGRAISDPVGTFKALLISELQQELHNMTSPSYWMMGGPGLGSLGMSIDSTAEGIADDIINKNYDHLAHTLGALMTTAAEMGLTAAAGSALDGLMSAEGAAVEGAAVESAGSSTFYTVQSEADINRLLNGGAPWPSEANRAALGEGVYSWSTREEAESYLQIIQKSNPDARILEFSIDNSVLSKLNAINLNTLSDSEAEAFMNQYSQLWGGTPNYEYDYIIRGTAIGNENYFSKYIINLLHFNSK